MNSGPDKSLSWVIALDCFLINFITVGISRTVGVLYVELIDLYGVDREAATTPFSIRTFTTNMTGPLVGFLGLKYGIRRITVIGGIVASLGSILCSFASNILWISIFWGLIHGFGYGFSTCLHMLTITQYFNKYRGTALGLGYSGDCFGNFAFPFIIEYMIEVYGVQGTFLIIGGILLNILPMAVLLKSPPWVNNERSGIKTRTIQSCKRSVKEQHTDLCMLNISKNSQNSSNLDTFQNKIHNHKSAAEIESEYSKDQSNTKQSNNKLLLHFHSSEKDLRRFSEDIGLQEMGYLNLAFSDIVRELGAFDFTNKYNITYNFINSPYSKKKNLNRFNRSTKSLPSSLRSKRLFKEYRGNVKCMESTEKRINLESKCACDRLNETFKYGDGMGKDAKCKRTLNLEAENDPKCYSMISKHEPGCISKYRRNSDVENKYYDTHNGVSQELILSVTKNMADNCLISNCEETEVDMNNRAMSQSMMKLFFRAVIKPIFILMSISSAVYAFLLTSILTIFIDYASDQGIPKNKGKYFIVGFSVADLVGRLVCGQVIDRNLMKIKNYVASIMLLMGMLSAFMPLSINFYYMMACICLYGVAQGGAAIMFPVLLNTYMDRNTHSVAMGCLNFYGGLLILLLPSTIHFFRDNTGSYKSLFYINGGIVCIAGFAWLFEPMMVKLQHRRIATTY